MKNSWLWFAGKVSPIVVALWMFVAVSSAWAEQQSTIDLREALAAANVEFARESGLNNVVKGVWEKTTDWMSAAF